jgi:hypothetical protein
MVGWELAALLDDVLALALQLERAAAPAMIDRIIKTVCLFIRFFL